MGKVRIIYWEDSHSGPYIPEPQITPESSDGLGTPWNRMFGSAATGPRPREGGDQEHRRIAPASACFDPRPREGGDPRSPRQCDTTENVATHAPVKGGTVTPS